MNWTLLAGPIIGSIIGYFTNYIAVKMLFRPWEPKYLFGKQLPFTPGIIPKSKDRIARTIGSAIGENLLTQDAIEKTVLSDELKTKLHDKVNETVERYTHDERLIRDAITYYVDGDQFDQVMERGENLAAAKLVSKIMEMNVGTIVATQVGGAIREKKRTSLLAKMLSEDVIRSLTQQIALRVNETVEQEGPELIRYKMHQEFSGLENKTVGEMFRMLEASGLDTGQLITSAYETLIRKKLSSILRTIDISKIVKDKLDAMDPKEMEALTLQVAKKELNAIINLGALIGFVLGCLNVVIALI